MKRICICIQAFLFLGFIMFNCFPAAGSRTDAAPGPKEAEREKQTQHPPGIVVAHSPHNSNIYLASPSIIILGENVFLASHCRTGPGTPTETRIYRSDDGGQNWRRISTVADIGLHWANLFKHRGDIYLLGADGHKNTVILKSGDKGRNWTNPLDKTSGLLLEGRYHPLSPSVTYHDGRIWRANEYMREGAVWGRNFEAFMMSAPADADLLKSENWLKTNRIGHNPAWLQGRFGGWLEGNAVVTPEGRIANILRVQFGLSPQSEDRGGRMSLPDIISIAAPYTQSWVGYSGDGKAAIMRISRDGSEAEFDPQRDFIEFPGGLVRFQIRKDPETDYYWSLTNYVPPVHRHDRLRSHQIRNTVALIRSKDLRSWELRTILLYEPDPLQYGFQYLSWQFDGDDIIALSRTSYPDKTSREALFRTAQSHDANYITFHRFENFRQLTMEDAADDVCCIGIK